MALVQRREKDERIVLTCASRTERGSHRAVLRFRVRRYCRNLDIFMACIYSSLASSAKLDVVKGDKAHEFGISWESSDYSIETSPRVPDQNNGTTIPDKKVGTRSKFSPSPTYNIDNQVIFSLFVEKK